MKIYLCFFILISLFIFCQSSFNPKKNYISDEDKKVFSNEFEEVLSIRASDMDDLYKNAEKMLKVSKTDEERSRAYFVMGDAMRKKLKYGEAIVFLKKADYYAEKSNFIRDRFLANLFLCNIYSTIGLTNNAKNSFKIAEKLAKTLNDSGTVNTLNDTKSYILRQESKYCEAAAYEYKAYENSKKYLKNNTGNSKYNFQAYCSLLAYCYLKCGKTTIAKHIIQDFEATYNHSTDYNQSYYLEFYYLDKALVFMQENNKKEARTWFDKAVNRAKEVKKTGSLATIMEERLLQDIGDNQFEKKYFKEYLNLYQDARKESIKVYRNEIENQEKNINYNRKFTRVLIVTIFFLIAGICTYQYYISRRRKELKAHFEEIIKKLEQQDTNSFPINQSTIKTETERNSEKPKQKVISNRKEVELLDKLITFETGREFTSPNFNKSNLAVILNTNIKYTQYILKEHRGKSFNEYINGLRIEFLTKLLYNEPKYLNYKINYLSELVGFSSHSYFTQVFKKELGIAPSDFIAQLSKSKKKQ